LGKKFGHSYPVGIRLRPNIMAGGNLKISTGHAESKFGIPLDNIDDVLKLQRKQIFLSATFTYSYSSEIKDVEVFAKGN
jgi:diaminopimelate decarboxylase